MPDRERAKPRRKAAWRSGLSEARSLGAVTAGGAFRRRKLRKADGRIDPHAGVDFKAIYADEAATVTADDGVCLAVRTVLTGGPDVRGDRKWGRTATPELTVVFVHGFTLRMAAWHFQRFGLAERWAGRHIKMVFYDQRGHGASDPASAESSTMAQLGDDLAAVIRTMAPTGPVVLVGHSMGGMSIMSFARRHSRMFSHSGRIAGVALVSTAARGITEAGLGEGLNNPIVDALRLSVRYIPGAVQAGRGITRRAVEPVLVAASFGHDHYSPRAGHAVESMIQNTSIATMVNFLHVLESHDEATALPVLAQVPTVVMCGDEDRLTPLPNSLSMYGQLGHDSRMVIAEGCGHMLPMEDPELVTDAIDDLVSRSRLALGRPVLPWRLSGRARSDKHARSERQG
ncbi:MULTISPECIES: alpha/beta fold hydrolase [Gordonia]|uniref:Putative hydrolase n=1 Tax=Gordonia sihwensis NBRC 108236 TaxID=1223544 RepID=L7LNS5_9ACTN|nr:MULTISPECIES: alpha/beta hydrolase [Gordonia]AUH70448.1 alpha/beta hydrolase [Gordonia sp. YC-JH1]MBY4570241.1 alpha/beta hydrolase [Gordonia sihwensis]WFN93885.1 alpha/beta hydrolase [Gordonia sihwensis]GAC61767.1 putative hydrolase [Gordonia sihwensis NBRC 108236]